MNIVIHGLVYTLSSDELRLASEEYQKQKNSLLAQFKALVKAHGWDVTDVDYQPFMDGDKMLCIKLPPANGEWSMAIMRALLEFCSKPQQGSRPWPRFDKDHPGNLLRIQL